MRSAKQPECVYVSVTLTRLACLAVRDGAKLRHDLQDTANYPPATRNYLCGQQSSPSQPVRSSANEKGYRLSYIG